MDWNTLKIQGPLDPGIFSDMAEQAAKCIAEESRITKGSNEPTQLRKFYDELIMWQQQVEAKPENLGELLPFIRMLKAKVAYAQGRNKVGPEYCKMINRLLDQVQADDPKTLKYAKTFLEAFTGYYKGIKKS